MAGTLRRRNKPNERRAQILDEAVRLIARDGFYRFTVEELAQRCGLSKGGLLHHFPTKEQLLLEVLEERDRRVESSLAPMLTQISAKSEAGGRPSLADALALLRAIVVQSAQQPELVRLYAVLQSEALDGAHPGYEYFRQREARVIEMLSQMVAGLSDAPRSMARQISAVMLGQQLQWLRADFGFDLVEEWDRAAAKLLPVPMPARRSTSRAKKPMKQGGRSGR